MAKHLYDSPLAYLAALEEPGEEELAFYRGLLGNCRTVLSAGCGAARMEALLSREGFRVVGFDLSKAMICEARRRDPRGQYILARMEAPPFRGRFDGAVSGLLSAAYLTDAPAMDAFLAGMRRVLVDGGPLALELPVAHHPARVQGICESAILPGGRFEFRYLDVISREAEFSVLDTLMEINVSGEAYERRAALAVYTPDGIRSVLLRAGFGDVTFYAPYDLESATSSPPEDCLRAVVVGRRKGTPFFCL